MKTATKARTNTDRLMSGVEKAILRQFRRLKRQEMLLKRKQARATKQLEREAYGWSSLGG